MKHSAILFATLLFFACSYARLYKPPARRLGSSSQESNTAGLFEDSLSKALGEITTDSTDALVKQYQNMIEWLDLTPENVNVISELKVHPGMSSTEIDEVEAAGTVASESIELANEDDEDRFSSGLDRILSSLKQVGSSKGFSSMRRLLIGAIVKKRVERKKPFSSEIQTKVDSILTTLFDLHRQSSATRGAIQFIHVSKSGGTNLCMCAEANGCSSESFDERLNCLVRDFNDQPRWVPKTLHIYLMRKAGKEVHFPWFVNFGPKRQTEVSCQQRAEHLRNVSVMAVTVCPQILIDLSSSSHQMSWNFHANEFTLPNDEEGMCQEFVNLMILRDPIKRLGSQIGWIQKLYKEVLNYEDNTTSFDISTLFEGRTASFWEELVPAAVNNYYIRSLLGPRFFESPILPINSTHIHIAMREVLQHDLLLILEKKELNDLVLQVGLGWEKSIQDAHIRSSSDMKDEIQMPINYDDLIERNNPDVEVYRLAEQLQLMDLVMLGFARKLEPVMRDLQSVKDPQERACGYVSQAKRKIITT